MDGWMVYMDVPFRNRNEISCERQLIKESGNTHRWWVLCAVDGVDGVLSLVVKVQVLESHITIRRLYSIKSFHLVSEEGCMNYEKIRLKNGKNRFVQRVLYKYFH